jgi:hypothetical protein
LPTIRIQGKPRVNPRSCHLVRYAANSVTSQNGEDGIIDKIFDIMPPANRFCVEFGAWDGKHLSNTWMLLNMLNWRGLLIEGNDSRFADLHANYVGNANVHIMNRFVDFDASSLDRILDEISAPRDFDLLCVDIDGNDWHVWESLATYRPRLVVIEFNPTIPNDVYFVQDRDPSIGHGASLCALIDLGKRKGYELVAALQHNAFFVRAEDFPLFDIADNDIDSMYDGSHFETKIFQGYDGTLFIAGCQHLLWKGVPISQEDIQVLPRAARQTFEPEPGSKDVYMPVWKP